MAFKEIAKVPVGYAATPALAGGAREEQERRLAHRPRKVPEG